MEFGWVKEFANRCTDIPSPSEKIGGRDVCEWPSLIVFSLLGKASYWLLC